MRRFYSIILALAVFGAVTTYSQAQKKPATPPQPAPHNPQTQQSGQPPAGQPRPQVFDLSEVGVQILPEPRLIVMMAALDAAGFDPTPAGEEPSIFRAQVRQDQANLDPDLKK